jgi:predicted  nucleic acid-binding Zn-ribbon protein
VLPALAALIALQKLDSAAEAAERRVADMPATLEAIDAKTTAAAEDVDGAKARIAANVSARRALEKQVAGVDSRLARSNDHKAAVKTNQEYTAVLHEIEMAQAEKDRVEEQILMLMEEADGLAAALKAAEAILADTRREGDTARGALETERAAIDEELARLAGARKGEVAGIDAPTLARYEQLLRGRKGVAVAPIKGEMCAACFVRLRPHFIQTVRRNDSIVQCESCQRILHFDDTKADDTKAEQSA